MRIILANKFYYRRGGDCISMLNLETLLKSQGHTVAIFAMQHPENLPCEWSRYFPSEVEFKPSLKIVESLRRPFGEQEVKRKFSALIADFKPDVVHLHNIHTQLSPIIGEIAHRQGVKVVWTLHDYKLLCARYDCLKRGESICEECFTNKRAVIENRCVKGSRVASWIGWLEAKLWNRERLDSFTDTFIAPSSFMADKMVQGGFSASKIVTIPNFINTQEYTQERFKKSDYYCYVGRLLSEKGVERLVKVAKELPYRLKIVGCGELEESLKELTQSCTHIEMVGYREWREVEAIVGSARFSVMPSEWYENNPLSIIESLSLGTPVLGADIGGIPELVENGVNGVLFESRNTDDLKAKIEEMFSACFDYAQIAKSAQSRYSPQSYPLIRYYEELCGVITSP